MRLCLVEDDAVSELEPACLTHPAFDLLLGSRTLGQRAARAFGVGWDSRKRGALVRPHLAGAQRRLNPGAAVNDRDWLARGPVIVANARWVPPADFRPPAVRRPVAGLCRGQIACAWAGPGQAMGLGWGGVDSWFDAMATDLDAIDVGGEWIDRLEDLVAGNADHLARDYDSWPTATRADRGPGRLNLVGPAERLRVHPTARIAPCTVLDTTSGTIAIEAGAVLRSSTRIEGPCYIGRSSRLSRASLRGGVTIGPNCLIGGEVERSIAHGHSRMGPGSFVGHAYLCEGPAGGVSLAVSSRSDRVAI